MPQRSRMRRIGRMASVLAIGAAILGNTPQVRAETRMPISGKSKLRNLPALVESRERQERKPLIGKERKMRADKLARQLAPALKDFVRRSAHRFYRQLRNLVVETGGFITWDGKKFKIIFVPDVNDERLRKEIKRIKRKIDENPVYTLWEKELWKTSLITELMSRRTYSIDRIIKMDSHLLDSYFTQRSRAAVVAFFHTHPPGKTVYEQGPHGQLYDIAPLSYPSADDKSASMHGMPELVIYVSAEGQQVHGTLLINGNIQWNSITPVK